MARKKTRRRTAVQRGRRAGGFVAAVTH